MKKYIVMILLCGGMSWGPEAGSESRRGSSVGVVQNVNGCIESQNFWNCFAENNTLKTKYVILKEAEIQEALAFLKAKPRNMKAVFDFKRWAEGRKAKLIWDNSKKEWITSTTQSLVISPKAYHILGAICIIEFGERLSTEVLANETIKGLHNKNYDKKEIIGILINASTKAEQIQRRKDVIGNIFEFIQKVAVEIRMHQTDEERLNFVETLSAILNALDTPEAIFDFNRWNKGTTIKRGWSTIGTLTPDLYRILAAAYLIDVYDYKNLNSISKKVHDQALDDIMKYNVQEQYKALFDKLKGQLNALQLGSADAHGGG